ncbi:hypothetical protein RIF25_06395 [Thermosynechococcaceae cyanobacterium BACA0444]|uniref:Uncharacterized protein n=1 Tax=Pseudocalidococcus azoricus BACA0444 TaxID=2918990 RepID=A0AAE4FT09_9CYAN|nr:hypothetical protein [Pseudocalidococcus azoricus]MDS3860436.1 hypothetical protein [Pseudocalidococcus azoricus BACA0444]
MDQEALRTGVRDIVQQRGALVQLLEQPDIGTLRIDINQALEELDDLLEEFKRTFPDLDVA